MASADASPELQETSVTSAMQTTGTSLTRLVEAASRASAWWRAARETGETNIFLFVDLEIFSHPDQAVTKEQASVCVKIMLRVGDVTGNTHF